MYVLALLLLLASFTALNLKPLLNKSTSQADASAELLLGINILFATLSTSLLLSYSIQFPVAPLFF